MEARSWLTPKRPFAYRTYGVTLARNKNATISVSLVVSLKVANLGNNFFYGYLFFTLFTAKG